MRLPANHYDPALWFGKYKEIAKRYFSKESRFFNDIWRESVQLDAGPVYGAKPLGFIKSMVENHTRPGDWILDPFCGRGTTARACLETGRNCLTIEANPKHAEFAQSYTRSNITPLERFMGNGEARQ